jgi:hypothetical protein
MSSDSRTRYDDQMGKMHVTTTATIRQAFPNKYDPASTVRAVLGA